MTQAERDLHLTKLVRYLHDFSAFCREVLGFTDMIRMEEEVIPGYSHDDLCRFLQHDPTKFKLILMPRYSFKSHLATIGKTLWDLARHDSLRILFCCDTNEKAEGFLEGVKNHIEGKLPTSTFRAVFGAWDIDPKQGVWNQREIVIRPRRVAQVEPSIETAGLESSKTGKHYDIIIFDDLVSEKNVTTPELIEKVKDVYRKSLSILKPDGEVRMLGTRWHFGDLYGAILAQEDERARQGQPKVFSTYIRHADVHGAYPFAKIGLTKEFLRHQHAEQGSYVFSCLYQQSPTDDATALFKLANFAFYDPVLRFDRRWLRSLFLTCCIDPAISERGAADDTAITVVGTDQDLTMHLLDVTAGHLLPDQLIEEVFRLHEQWVFRVVGLETNAFQKMLKRDMERRFALARRSNPGFQFFHIEEFTGTSVNTKDLRIRALQPIHERQALKLPGTRIELLTGAYQKLVQQMLQYPHAPHDDVLDSLAYHVPIHRGGQVTPTPQDVPYGSAAWAALRQWHRQRSVLNRAPRWQRRPLPMPVFN